MILWSWKWRHEDRWIWLDSRFKLSLSTLNSCIISSLYGFVYDPNGPSLPDGQKIKVCEVLHTPIHSLSNITSSCVPRTTNSSLSLSWHTHWLIVIVRCMILAPSIWQGEHDYVIYHELVDDFVYQWTQLPICWSSKKYCDKLWKFVPEYCWLGKSTNSCDWGE